MYLNGIKGQGHSDIELKYFITIQIKGTLTDINTNGLMYYLLKVIILKKYY